MANFGPHGELEVGEAKYASVTPHHTREDGAYVYVQTFDAAIETALTAAIERQVGRVEVVLQWIGRDGEQGQTYLVRQVGGVTDLVPIPEECVVEFDADTTEEDADGVLTQTSFNAIVGSPSADRGGTVTVRDYRVNGPAFSGDAASKAAGR